MAVRIIIFHDNINDEVFVHADENVKIMYFSRGDKESYPSEVIEQGDITWAYEALQGEDKLVEFDKIWKEGLDIENDPDRIKRKDLDGQIKLLSKTLEDLRAQRDKLE